MNQNITLSIGNLLLVDKFNEEYGYFNQVFNGIGGKAKNILPCVKLFIHNRLGECFSINQIIPGYNQELFQKLQFSEDPKERSLYRNLERLVLIFRSLLGAIRSLFPSGFNTPKLCFG